MNTTPYRPGLEIPPERMRSLPVDRRGYPVPWFVQWIDGAPDFRVIDGEKFRKALKLNRCWLCGEPLGSLKAFVIGPMCVVNRTTSEPPSHLACAQYAVRNCPFMVLPKSKRREANLPEGTVDPAGMHLARNPGAMCVWVSRGYTLFRVNAPVAGALAATGGVLIRIGEPVSLAWYAEGRAATRAEVESSIDSGLPFLSELAEQQDADERSTQSAAALAAAVAGAKQYLPAA